ncbi:transmembrane protein, putative, partial [Bodo saltans]
MLVRSQFTLRNLALENEIWGTSLLLFGVVVNGAGAGLLVANVSVVVGPSPGVRPVQPADASVIGIYVVSCSAMNVVSLTFQRMLCVHDMSLIDSRCIVFQQCNTTNDAHLRSYQASTHLFHLVPFL